MSRVHYFARYSQKENIVTNNTLLLFNRLYSDSNEKFNIFLKSLLFEEEEIIDLDTRISFEQQVKSGNSVPDAIISLNSFKIVIETKLHKQENLEQINNHLSAFENEDVSIILFISKNRISNVFKNNIREQILFFNEENNKNINFIATTFKKICNKFEEVIADYREFCLETGIINNYDTKMRGVPTVTTHKQNIENNIYYYSFSIIFLGEKIL